MVPASLRLSCLSANPQGQGPGGEHISNFKVEIRFEEAAYLPVQTLNSVSMATQPQHLLLLSLPAPPICLLQVCAPIPSQIPFPGDSPLASLFPLCDYFKI